MCQQTPAFDSKELSSTLFCMLDLPKLQLVQIQEYAATDFVIIQLEGSCCYFTYHRSTVFGKYRDRR